MATTKTKGLLLLSFSLFLLLNITNVNSITIKTSSKVLVYEGPGGVVEKAFQNSNSIKKISPYFSVVSFMITGTTLEKYNVYDSSIQEIFGPPQVKVIKGSSVDPIPFGSAASGYFFDSSLYWLEIPELSIYFNCQENGFSVIEISINSTLIHNIDGVSKSTSEIIQFYLQKECYNAGFREGFTISKNDNAIGDVVKHGVVQSKWSLDSEYYLYKDPVVIPEREHMSLFNIFISNPDYGNQYFDPPVIKVSDPDTLSIKARGSAEKGGIASGVYETLFLFYTCNDKGSVEVIIEVSIGFYGDLIFGFTKDCTPQEEENEEGTEHKLAESGLINVGTSRSFFSNVIENNVPTVSWRAEQSLINVDKDEITSIFYISTLSGKEQPFLKPIVSINPPNAFKVTVTGPARNGGIATGNPQRLIINYICDRVSEAEVIVSIKLPGYETVEFGFNKQCKKLVRHSDHIWTANQLLLALLVGVISILIVIFLLLRKKQTLPEKSLSKA